MNRLSASLAAVLAVVAFPWLCGAEDVTLANLTYSLDASTHEATVTAMVDRSSNAAVEIPQTVTGSDGAVYTVTSLGQQAFEGCQKMPSIKLPATIKTINTKAFNNCYALSSINLPEGLVSIGQRALNNVRGVSSLVVPSTVTFIGENAFSYMASLNTLTLNCPAVLPPSAVSAENWDTKSVPLHTLILGDAVTQIREYTYKGMPDLTTVIGGENVTSVGEYAFDGCYSLSAFPFTNKLTSIGAGAFKGTALTDASIYVDGDLNDSMFEGCIYLKRVYIGDKVTQIRDQAFMACPQLQWLTIGKNVTRIRLKAFSGCSSLKSVAIPAACSQLMSSVFEYCSALESVEIPEGVTVIGSDLFKNCTSLREVTIPSTVTTIGAAFGGCSALEKVTINSLSGSLGASTFANCTSLREVTVNGGVSKIMTNVFYPNCSALSTLTLNCPITQIGTNAFCGASALKELTLPQTLTSIGSNAFQYAGLEHIVLPQSVTTLASMCFDCDPLSVTVCNVTPPSSNQKDICHSYSTTVLRVPAGSEEAYRTTLPWSKFTNIEAITAPTAISVPASINLNQAATFTIPVEYEPAGSYAPVQWSVSDEGIATIDKNTVKGVAEGTATLTATIEGSDITASTELQVVGAEGLPMRFMVETADGSKSVEFAQVGFKKLTIYKGLDYAIEMLHLNPDAPLPLAPVGTKTFSASLTLAPQDAINIYMLEDDGTRIPLYALSNIDVDSETTIDLYGLDGTITWTGQKGYVTLTLTANCYGADALDATDAPLYPARNVAIVPAPHYDPYTFNLLTWNPGTVPDRTKPAEAHNTIPFVAGDWQPVSADELQYFHDEYHRFKDPWIQGYNVPDGKFVYTAYAPEVSQYTGMLIDGRANDNKIWGVPNHTDYPNGAADHGTQYFELWDGSSMKHIVWQPSANSGVHVQLTTYTFPSNNENGSDGSPSQPRYLSLYRSDLILGIDRVEADTTPDSDTDTPDALTPDDATARYYTLQGQSLPCRPTSAGLFMIHTPNYSRLILIR